MLKIKFVLKTLRHKFHVIRFGMKTKAPLWRLIIHDWTKFTPAEFPFYAVKACGGKVDEIDFALAWNHHHKSNPHHWEYWIPVTAHNKSTLPGNEPLPMPEWAVREMLADWLAATYGEQGIEIDDPANWEWFQKEKTSKLRLHEDSWKVLDQVMSEYFSRCRGKIAAIS